MDVDKDSDYHAKVREVFKTCDLDRNGTLDRAELGEVLQILEPRYWTEERIDGLFKAIDVGSDDLIQFSEMFEWLFDKREHALFKLATDGSGLESATSAVTEVEVIWSDSSGLTKSRLLGELSLEWTLAALKNHCAEALGVESVQAQDFNEDMDGRTLLELGIGVSGLPFAIIGGPAAARDSTDAARPTIALGSASTASTVSAIGAASRKAPAPLKQRQAKADASDVYDGWLFLGGQLAASNRAALQELGVTHVINCCDRIPCHFKKTFTYLKISVFDTKSSDIRKHFPEALDFLDRAYAEGGGCLVHCMVGASRSASIVLAWLVSRCKMPLLEAFKGVRARRGVARPNRSFCLQLMEFEEEVLGSCSAKLPDFGHT